eukprot:1881666-Amphidinium_carterae.1
MLGNYQLSGPLLFELPILEIPMLLFVRKFRPGCSTCCKTVVLVVLGLDWDISLVFLRYGLGTLGVGIGVPEDAEKDSHGAQEKPTHTNTN